MSAGRLSEWYSLLSYNNVLGIWITGLTLFKTPVYFDLISIPINISEIMCILRQNSSNLIATSYIISNIIKIAWPPGAVALGCSTSHNSTSNHSFCLRLTERIALICVLLVALEQWESLVIHYLPTFLSTVCWWSTLVALFTLVHSASTALCIWVGKV